jgi:hypothetical protein
LSIFFEEAIGKAVKTAHVHARAEILALYKVR